MIWVIGIPVFCLITIFAIWYVRREIEIKDMLRQACKAEDSLDRGIAVFKPEKREQIKIFEILTRRKIMKRNPLGGYSFAQAHTDLMARSWGKKEQNVLDEIPIVENSEEGEGNG